MTDSQSVCWHARARSMDPVPWTKPSGLADNFWLMSPAAMPHPASIRPSIALAAFAEKFIDGRRIVVFGNALSSFWEQLIERGARLVHVCDTDSSRVSEAAARNTSQHVSFAPLAGNGLAVRDGAFDVGFIENLSLHTDAPAALHRLRRALSPRGIAFVAAPNPDVEDAMIAGSTDGGRSLDYYTLYDSVHREFPVVRMAGQMPFVGYSVAELAPAEEPVPSIDAGFVPGGTEEPEWFVAIATAVDVQFESFVVIQLPYDRLAKNGSERLLREQLRAARSAERSAVERLSRIESEQRRLAEVAQRHQKDIDLARQLRLLQEELERKESWILQLEARAATADARADEADQELDELKQRFALTGAEAAKPQPVAEDWRKTLERLESEKCELYSRLSAAEAEPQLIEQRFAAQHASLTDALKLAQQQLQQLEQNASLERADALKLAQEQLQKLEQSASVERADALELAHEQLRKLERDAAREREELDARVKLAEAKAAETLNQLQHASVRLADVDRVFEEQQRASVRLADVDRVFEEQQRASAAELAQLEQQLRERGERIRQLESELRATEELGRRLVRELERVQDRTRAAGSDQPTATAAVTSPELPDTAICTTIATETWSATTATTTPASTHLSTEHASAWVDPTTTKDDQPLRDKLSHLADLVANRTADLVAYEWRLQQLVAERDSLAQRCETATQLAAELEAARTELQRNEVLFAELAARGGADR